MEKEAILYVCVGIIIFLSLAFLIFYLFFKREVLYVKKKNMEFPHTGLTVALRKHLPTLKMDYVFNMKVYYTGGSKRYVELFRRDNTKFILDMSKGSLILEFYRFPTAINNLSPDTPNLMRINTLSIIPFQKDIRLEIKQNLRNIEIVVNRSSVHSETLPYIPYVGNTNGLLLIDGGSDYVYLKKFDHKV